MAHGTNSNINHLSSDEINVIGYMNSSPVKENIIGSAFVPIVRTPPPSRPVTRSTSSSSISELNNLIPKPVKPKPTSTAFHKPINNQQITKTTNSVESEYRPISAELEPTIKVNQSANDTKLDKNCKMEGLEANRVLIVRGILRDIPTFSGKRDSSLEESVNIFLTEVKDACEFLNDGERELLISKIKSRFRGDALILVNVEKFNKYEELEEFMYRNYLPRRDPYEVIREINTIRQRPEENILTYSERLKNLVGLAHGLIDQAYHNQSQSDYKKDISKQAIRSFKFGIRDHTIQTALFHQDNANLDDTIDAALRWEKIEKIRHGSVFMDTTPSNKTDILLETLLEKLNVSTDKNKEMKNIERTSMNRNPQNANYQRENKFCEFCRRKGHLITECRTKMNTPFCNYCHNYSHKFDECPMRKNLNGANRSNGAIPRTNNFRTNNYNNASQPPYRLQNTQQYPMSQNYNKYMERERPNYPARQQYPRENYRSNNNNNNSISNRQFQNGAQAGIRLLQHTIPDDLEYKSHNCGCQGNENGAGCSPQSVNPNQEK